MTIVYTLLPYLLSSFAPPSLSRKAVSLRALPAFTECLANLSPRTEINDQHVSTMRVLRLHFRWVPRLTRVRRHNVHLVEIFPAKNKDCRIVASRREDLSDDLARGAVPDHPGVVPSRDPQVTLSIHAHTVEHADGWYSAVTSFGWRLGRERAVCRGYAFRGVVV